MGIKAKEFRGYYSYWMDEIQWKKGHKYLTLVYQINQGCVRLLWIGFGEDRGQFQ